MFGLFKKEKKKFPILEIEMFDPVDQPITVATGKKLVNDFLFEIGFADDKQDAKEYGMEFEDHLQSDLQQIKDNIEGLKDEIKDCKEEIKKIEKSLKDLTDEDEIEDQKDEIDGEKDTIKLRTEEINAEQSDFDTIKNDKNHALKKLVIDYVNSTVHGDDWKDKI